MRRSILTGLLAVALSFAAARAGTIRIGAVLPLTGPAAQTGLQQMRGIQFAIDEANAKGGVHGNRIEVVFEDNQAKPDLSIRCFNRLADLPVIFTAYSGPTLAMAPLATRKQVLLVNASGQADRLATASPYLFNTVLPIRAEIAMLTRYLAGPGKQRAAILFENDPAGISGRDDFADEFPMVGGRIVAEQSTQFGQTEFRRALSKLAEAKPDVMLVSVTTGLDAMAQQYVQSNLAFTVAGTFLQNPELLKDPAADGFAHIHIRVAAPPALAAAFAQKFGVEMGLSARLYYNAAQVVLTALGRLVVDGQPISGEAMRKTILAIRRFQGLVSLEFNTNTATVPFDIDRIQAGQDRKIED